MSRNISKTVNVGGAKTYILRDINCKINEGEFVSIWGLQFRQIIAQCVVCDDPTEDIIVLWRSCAPAQRKAALSVIQKYIGFVFQAYHLIDELTVYENIETPLIYQDMKSSERKAVVADILDRFQIVGKKDLFPTQLSGGQQQLVGIARALVAKPKLILADEPTGNLNSKQGDDIMKLFKN